MNRHAQTTSSRIRQRRAAGLSLIEALISLAITATLLTAVGVAYQIAGAAVEQNDQFFRASQAARVTINQVTADIRKCTSGSIDPSGTSLTLDVAGTGDSDILTVTYAFDNANNRMTRTGRHPDGTTQFSVMGRHVQAVHFDTNGPTISMMITVMVGNNQILLNSSATPRRLIVYQ